MITKSPPHMAVGLQFQTSSTGLERTGELVRLYGATLAIDQTRYCVLSLRGYTGVITGLLSNAFDILAHEDFAYVGTTQIQGQYRDLYVPSSFKHIFRPDIIMNY